MRGESVRAQCETTNMSQWIRNKWWRRERGRVNVRFLFETTAQHAPLYSQLMYKYITFEAVVPLIFRNWMQRSKRNRLKMSRWHLNSNCHVMPVSHLNAHVCINFTLSASFVSFKIVFLPLVLSLLFSSLLFYCYFISIRMRATRSLSTLPLCLINHRQTCDVFLCAASTVAVKRVIIHTHLSLTVHMKGKRERERGVARSHLNTLYGLLVHVSCTVSSHHNQHNISFLFLSRWGYTFTGESFLLSSLQVCTHAILRGENQTIMKIVISIFSPVSDINRCTRNVHSTIYYLISSNLLLVYELRYDSFFLFLLFSSA